MDKPTKHIFEFGPFRLDPVKRLLLRDEQIVPLTSRVFDVLLLLVQNRGRLIEKEELMREVWRDTIVEEGNLNRNISTLRKALGESPEEHSYIVTVPKQGYRFVASVSELLSEDVEFVVEKHTLSRIITEAEGEIKGQEGALTEISAESEEVPGHPEEVEEEFAETKIGVTEEWDQGTYSSDFNQARGRTSPADYSTPALLPYRRASRRRLMIAWLAVAAGGALVGLAFIIYYSWLKPDKPSAASLRVSPFTTFPGRKAEPAFSPDGNQIAFVWDGGDGDNFDIYVKLIDTGTPLRLTVHPANERSPAWSPDGRHIAFLRYSKSEKAIFIVPALGGTERKLASLQEDAYLRAGSSELAWSPDGKLLAVTDKSSPQEPYSIFLISRESGEKRRLTTPPAGYFGDKQPRFSPDGQRLAFVRGPSFLANDVYLVPVGGGEPRRLTFDNLALGILPGPGGLAWSSDGREILFSSSRGGSMGLWRISASGGAPEPLLAVGENARDPSISRRGDRLAYTYRKVDSNIWRAVGPNSTVKSSPPIKFISSTRQEGSNHFSPDGKKIAFASDRSGSWEIWVCDGDGLNPIQLTNFGGPWTGTPRWSPDGRHISFDSRAEGDSNIYIISAEGGQPRRITMENTEENLASWSRDGRWLYFTSNRSGDFQIWKTPAEGGEPVQVTKHGAYAGLESPDGKFIYYTKWIVPGIWYGKLSEAGIWRVPAEGGEEIRILDQEIGAGEWAVQDQGICFINRKTNPPTIELFNFADRQMILVTTLEKEPDWSGPFGFSLSPDGQWILFKRIDQLDNDIILVENFR